MMNGGRLGNLLLILWVAFIAADRIDLAGGHGPFLLVPFLALTPIVVLSELVRHRLTRAPIRLPRLGAWYALLALALLVVILISVLVASDVPIAANRAELLSAEVAGTFAVALLIADRPNLGTLLARGAIIAIALFVVFDTLESLYWIGRAPEAIHLGIVDARLDQLQNAGLLPRLAGPGGDGNRSAFVLVYYIAVIAVAAQRGWVRSTALVVGVLCFIATASRSGLLGGLAALAFAVWHGRVFITARMIAVAAVSIALIASYFLVAPDRADRFADAVASPLAERVSTKQGSAEGHIELIERGFTEATSSIPHSMIGLGYGTAYLVLQDFFPGNRYGNFHSLYVTMFAESGIFALILSLVLMVYPLTIESRWRALVAGALAFNVFYQSTAEPLFWFLLASAWMALSLRRFIPAASRTAGTNID